LKIGRAEFGVAKGAIWWGFEKNRCGCYILDLGRFYFTWLSKECK
jgi:hypothetical protein